MVPSPLIEVAPEVIEIQDEFEAAVQLHALLTVMLPPNAPAKTLTLAGVVETSQTVPLCVTVKTALITVIWPVRAAFAVFA